MRTVRFFCQEISQNAILSDSQFRHLTKVLRLQIGDPVELFDGKGTLAKAIINKIEKNRAILTIEDVKNIPKPQNHRIIIVSSIAKGERFEILVAKCTELGVDRITPVIFERTVKQALQHKRLETIAVESAKQCQRLFLPQIDQPMNIQQAIETLQTEYPNAKIIFGSLSADTKSILNIDFDSNDLIAFIGPEGGLTDAEENMLKHLNAQPVSLTDTTLRIETAAIAAAAVLAAIRTANG